MVAGAPARNGRYRNESLQKGLSVLSVVAASASPVSVTEVAGATGLDYSTAYRLVATLLELGYLEREQATKRYRVGAGVLHLGYAYVRTRGLHQAALPIMQDLAASTGETVNLSVRDGLEMVLIDACESRHVLSTRTTIGGRYPLHCTASGKVVLAGLPKTEVDAILAELPLRQLTERTIRSRRALLADVAEVRRQGYAVNDEEHVVGLVAIAAPVRDHTGSTVGALDIAVPTARITAQRPLSSFVPAVLDGAARVSSALGFRVVSS